MNKKYLSLLLLTLFAVAGFNTAHAANLVKNGSFETPLASSTAWPHYFASGAVPNWTWKGVNSMVNDAGGPFWDNGVAPDGLQVGGVQNPTTMTQAVSGFVAGKTYVVTFSYNARGGSKAMMGVTIDGTTQTDASVPRTIVPVGSGKPFYQFKSEYTATKSGDLNFSIAQLNPPDNTLLFDNIIIQEKGSAPEMSVAPATLDFGPVTTGVDNTIGLVVRNNGGTTLSISAAALSGTNKAAYSLPNLALPLKVSPFSGTATINVVCRPTTDGTLNDAALTLTSDASTTPTQVVPLKATAYSTAVIVNGSFELPVKAASDTMGTAQPIPGWTGAGGVQKEGEPHFENGKVPDGIQVLWLQQTASRTQSIPGFRANHHYKIGLYANARNTGGNVATLRVLMDGVNLVDSPTTITAVDGLNTHSKFFPAYSFNYMPTKTGSHTLEIKHENVTALDRTLFIDNVTITELVDPVRSWSLFE